MFAKLWGSQEIRFVWAFLEETYPCEKNDNRFTFCGFYLGKQKKLFNIRNVCRLRMVFGKCFEKRLLENGLFLYVTTFV
jgi:hypothetical protein